jgi:hypothetical protein
MLLRPLAVDFTCWRETLNRDGQLLRTPRFPNSEFTLRSTSCRIYCHFNNCEKKKNNKEGGRLYLGFSTHITFVTQGHVRL